MKTILRTLSLAGLLLPVTDAHSQSVDADSLRGLKTLGILVETLPPEAASCGLTHEMLDTSVRFILGQSRMKIAPAGSSPYVYLQVNMLPNCVSNYALSVNATVTINESNSRAYGAEVWLKGGLRSGGNAAVDTISDVEEIAKQLVNDWNSVN